jgi:hypothetical protein
MERVQRRHHVALAHGPQPRQRHDRQQPFRPPNTHKETDAPPPYAHRHSHRHRPTYRQMGQAWAYPLHVVVDKGVVVFAHDTQEPAKEATRRRHPRRPQQPLVQMPP